MNRGQLVPWGPDLGHHSLLCLFQVEPGALQCTNKVSHTIGLTQKKTKKQRGSWGARLWTALSTMPPPGETWSIGMHKQGFTHQGFTKKRKNNGGYKSQTLDTTLYYASSMWSLEHCNAQTKFHTPNGLSQCCKRCLWTIHSSQASTLLGWSVCMANAV